jgi:hypothetical protein
MLRARCLHGTCRATSQRTHRNRMHAARKHAHLQDRLPLRPEVLQQHELGRAAQLAHQLHVGHVQRLAWRQLRRRLAQTLAGSGADAADHVCQLRGVRAR